MVCPTMTPNHLDEFNDESRNALGNMGGLILKFEKELKRLRDAKERYEEGMEVENQMNRKHKKPPRCKQ